ncbi:MAG: STAS domain-containing protein [Actinomycetota bacterium]|nr:STAS domain-containing protein [Euzebyales bacterium]MDQ3528876.1 STAS domain-containing protein [Actinomycetota bacterium]
MVIDSPIDGVDIARLCGRVRALLERNHSDLLVCDVGALVETDVGTIDVVARLQLTAQRLGWRIALRHASGQLCELLVLAGLGDVVPLAAALRLEPQRQTEQREHPGGVEEGVEPDDATA